MKIDDLAENHVTLLPINYRDPDYRPIFAERARRLCNLRANLKDLPLIKRYYADHVAQFISDWALTIDPRVLKPRSPIMPFVLFPKQIELIHWIEEGYKKGAGGVMVKSRDVGASWVAMAWACTKCLFSKDFMVGFGSAKEDKVDRSGDPDTLFYKARMFLQWLPEEFRCGWNIGKHSAHMRLFFPETGASITGEAGDNIGRGGRKAVYFVDEAAHVERPKLIDASLAATTDCRIDMSSVNTMANSFAEKAHDGVTRRFDFGWRDDPRKDQEWYERKKRELDPVIVSQEIDNNFNAAINNTIIPNEMVQAAIGLHLKLGIPMTGTRRTALDVADQGRDKNAVASRKGLLLDYLKSWSGKGSDLYATTTQAVGIIESLGEKVFEYDADGMGANVRGDVRVINELRQKENPREFRAVTAVPFRGSGEILWPTKKAPRSELKNEDMFANYKAQSWWHLYIMFNESWKASKGEPYDASLIICIDPELPELSRLTSELSQPVWKWQPSGKRIVDKTPDEVLSPNLADAVMMVYAPRKNPLTFSEQTLRDFDA
jgi:phage terminase large subunit